MDSLASETKVEVGQAERRYKRLTKLELVCARQWTAEGTTSAKAHCRSRRREGEGRGRELQRSLISAPNTTGNRESAGAKAGSGKGGQPQCVYTGQQKSAEASPRQGHAPSVLLTAAEAGRAELGKAENS